MENSLKTTRFKTRDSINKAKLRKRNLQIWSLDADGKTFTWSNRLERVQVIREGIPYGSLEILSKKINSPVKVVLNIIGVPQTTYNKKKSSHSLLDSRDSELVLRISELIDFEIDVFINEEVKFQGWLNKPNLSLRGVPPIKFFDTISCINEVTFCLNRIEYGNFA